ncbi:BEN domain-containing protein 6-like [Linepithema humile]|uniref:BEN domain-containing protein 6-like n=1 Tax=Linepithema humile TaxID=83485 RepID=UPI00351E3B7C
MKKLLKTCQWQVVVVKLLAFGEWVKMCEYRDNLTEYGVLQPTKEARKIIRRKEWSDDDENSEIRSKKKMNKVGVTKNEINESKSLQLLKELKTFKRAPIEIDYGTSSDEENYSKMSKNDLSVKNDLLKFENESLKKENAALRVTLHSLENLPKMKDMTETVLSNLEKINENVHLFLGKNLLETAPSTSKLNPTTNYKFTDKRSSESRVDEEPIPYFTNENTIDECSDRRFNMPSKKSSNDIDLGGKGKYFLNASLIRNCNKSSVSQYTCDLLSVMFTKEELASCSLTGKIPNTMKGTATKAKPRLDPNRIEAIEAHVFSKFECTKDSTKLFKLAIRQKCNNAVPRASKTHQNH